jgi:hypothetical protein
MSIYTFSHKRGPGDPPDHVEVTVSFDDETDATLDHVISAFVQFLEGCSFSHASVRKFIDHEFTQ